MKKALFFLFALFLFWSACEKSDLELREESAIDSYIESGLIEEEPTSSGLYYILDEIDSTEVDVMTPNVGDTIVFDFVGKMLTVSQQEYFSTVGDEPLRFTFGKDQTIDGLKEGLSLVVKGSQSRLVVPSDIAYGDVQYGDIPPFTPLLIELAIHDIIRPENAVEKSAIEQYISTNEIDVEPQESGLYFILLDEDETRTDKAPPVEGDKIIYNFVGKMLTQDLQSIDMEGEQSLEVVYKVDELIKAFDEAFALMKAGDKAQLIVPSSLAYGSSQKDNIPPFTPLLIELTIQDIIRSNE